MDLTEIFKKQRYYQYSQPKLVKVAKDSVQRLTEDLTKAETYIGNLLKELNLSFDYQFVVYTKGKFVICDIYILQKNLIIELDGNQHYTEEGIAKDLNKEKILRDCGFPNIIRLENNKALNLDKIQLLNILEKYPSNAFCTTEKLARL